jgi:hypothetical protein
MRTARLLLAGLVLVRACAPILAPAGLYLHDFNVEDQGCKADGTDQTSCFQAIDNAAKAAGGRIIEVPAGTWKINGTVSASILNTWLWLPGAVQAGSGKITGAMNLISWAGHDAGPGQTGNATHVLTPFYGNDSQNPPVDHINAHFVIGLTPTGSFPGDFFDWYNGKWVANIVNNAPIPAGTKGWLHGYEGTLITAQNSTDVAEGFDDDEIFAGTVTCSGTIACQLIGGPVTSSGGGNSFGYQVNLTDSSSGASHYNVWAIINENSSATDTAAFVADASGSVNQVEDAYRVTAGANFKSVLRDQPLSSFNERMSVSSFSCFGDSAQVHPLVCEGYTGTSHGILGTFSGHDLELRVGNVAAGVIAQGGGLGIVQCGKLTGANFNSTADQAITIDPPSPNYEIQSISITNPSISMTTAQGGVYTAASKGGIQLVAATQVYSALTTNAIDSTGNFLNLPIINNHLMDYATLYLSLTTAQGAAATADVQVQCRGKY